MMDIPMMDSYLESLAGYIRDDDKLVTYKWLSKELEVHVNIAKIILSNYWEKYKNNELVATFMLIGNLKSHGMRVEVVKDVDLSKAKEKFEKIISEHIYSLQKTLTDIELLAITGKGDSRYSAITCEKSVILSDEELLRMRWGKATIPQGALTEKKTEENVSTKKTEQNVTSKKTEHNIFSKKTEQNDFSKKTEQNISSKKDSGTVKESPKSTDESKSETETKSEEKPAKKISPPTKSKGNEKKGAISKKPVQTTKVGFGNLFGKAINQQKVQAGSSTGNGSVMGTRKESDDLLERKTSNASVERARKKSDDSPERKSSKATDDNSFEKAKDKENEKSLNVTRNERASLSPEKEISNKNKTNSKKIEKSNNSKKSNGKKNEKNSRGKKRERSREFVEETKKRKRILVASDSSEESAPPSDTEDMFDSSSYREPSPIKNKSPSPPMIQQVGNKRKVRKLVDKTFVDDEGFLVTKKVHVYESCSEEEPDVTVTEKKIEPEVAEKKKPIDSERPKENKENVKKKQTTLMNFFKKA